MKTGILAFPEKRAGRRKTESPQVDAPAWGVTDSTDSAAALLTAREVARKLGIGQSRISRLVRLKIIQPDFVSKTADLFRPKTILELGKRIFDSGEIAMMDHLRTPLNPELIKTMLAKGQRIRDLTSWKETLAFER